MCSYLGASFEVEFDLKNEIVSLFCSMCKVLIKIQESDTYIKCFNWSLLALYSRFLGSSLK